MAVAIFAGGLAAPVFAGMRPIARLGVGDSVFWAPDKPIDGNDRLRYRIEVTERGDRLRVALDHSTYRNSWTLNVRGPQGLITAQPGPYSSEAFISDPSPGIYTVTASPRAVVDSVIRFRAKLENVTRPQGTKELLPNLRISPPAEITLTGAPWYFESLGDQSPSCFPEETAQEQVTRCLRFSFGPENAGVGPLELIYAAPQGEGGEFVMYQRITHANGKKSVREAGAYEYHAPHAHYHHKLIAGQQLFKVLDPKTGAIEPAGEAKKTGFCMGDYYLVDWERFYQDPIWSVESGCGVAPVEEIVMGLSTGWADIYGYELEGNYIDFSNGEDGLYVIRAFTDQSGEIKEANEKDNISYAYIEISGDEIRLIERGYGESPWDPRKSVLVDPRNYSIP